MARTVGRALLYTLLLFVISLPLMIGFAKAQSLEPQEDEHVTLTKPDAATQEGIDGCMACHAKGSESGPPVTVAHLMKSPHAALGCTTCHAGITEAPHTPAMLEEKPACASCHPSESEQFATSVHARPDKQPGDHPTCVTCHGDGDNHSIKLYGTWTRDDKVNVCSTCHRDTDRMARYGPNVGSVSSYEHSFHGRALLKYDSQETAICVDCHGSHGVLHPSDPKAATSPESVAATCAKCHPGAGQNFAVSGSSHMDLTIERQPVLNGVLLFFKILVGGMASFLMLGVLLDLRRSIFGKVPPRTGRFVGIIVSLGFLCLVAAIGQATFGIRGGTISTLAGVGLLVGSVVIYKWQHRSPGPKPKKEFDRFHPSMRVQHMLLVISFTLLIVTGMPIRNPQTETLRQIYLSLGGLDVGRVIHRVAGVVLIVVFLWHVLELLWKWKKARFTMASWTMLPNKQDVQDFLAETKSYFGGDTEPRTYGRFHFRAKLDYFAEYWGIPLMVITGLILWFPVYFGNALPPMAVPIAFIAHSYEAVLAFIAILTWHLYNSYFNLNHFAMSAPWDIGKLSHEDMRHVHPRELEEALAKEAVIADADSDEPQTESDDRELT